MTQSDKPGVSPPEKVQRTVVVDESVSLYNIHMDKWIDAWAKAAGPALDGVATGALIFDGQHRVLLVQRAAADSMPNFWETPGGAVDDVDATILVGCAREVFEETGLIVTRIRRAVSEGPEIEPGSVFRNSTRSKLICRLNFEVEVEDTGSVHLDPKEHQSFVWATEEEVRSEKAGEREIPLTSQAQSRVLLEAFRLRREEHKL